MKQVTLNTTSRTSFGRSAARHLRQDGVVPAIIYGESGCKHLALNAHEFAMAYRSFAGRTALIELKGEDGHSTYAIIQELQRNPRDDSFIHVDFKEIVRGKEMEAEIPVHTRGTADGVRNYGGVLEISTHSLKVRCRPRDLPEEILIDVTDLHIGRSIHLAELQAPEGVKFLDDPEQVIVACVGASSGAAEEVEAAEEAGEAGEGEAAEAESEKATSED